MKNTAKFLVVAVFGVFVLGFVLNRAGSPLVFAKVNTSPTPPVANTSSATNTTPPSAASGDDKTIPKTFALSKDSLSEYGESPFNHDNHAFLKYSPDGNSVMACTECHHTDQPKSALKLPDITSERDVALTLDVFKTSTQKVKECRACHFQDGNVPEGKTMPSITDGGKVKDMNNELAFHINCNNCHDAAFKLRPELKKKPGFATGKDCTICHKSN
jgi:cytochrome c553